MLKIVRVDMALSTLAMPLALNCWARKAGIEAPLLIWEALRIPSLSSPSPPLKWMPILYI